MLIDNKRKSIFPTTALLVVIGLSIALGYYIGQSQVFVPIKGVDNLDKGQPENVDFSLFWDAWRLIQEKFVNRDSLDYQTMVYGAISGMINALDDPYTVFLDPEAAERFEEDISGFFEGVGMEVGIRKGQLQVIAPLENTPAQRAGLRSGDKIIEIDGQSTINMTLDEAVSIIRGPKGTAVVLTIYREGETQDISVVRDVIKVPSLSWEMKEDNIAYLRIHHFSEKADSDFKEAATQILKSPAQKIILDLRNNPGGYLEVAQRIAGWFLERGQIVAIEDFGPDEESKEYKAKGNEQLIYYPVVVLINQGSASASEILAGALRDNREVVLIGESSFGKGSVQQLEALRDGRIKITVANWLTPKGELITDIGLEPEVKIEMTAEDYDEDRDPQLNKALEIIKSILIE